MGLGRLVRSPDIAFGLLGGSLIVCAFAFAILGIPPLPPAPIVLLGMPSPLTGMTRSFVAAAGGHLGRAFALHPLGPAVMAACALAVANAVHLARTGERARIVQRCLSLRHGGAAVVTAVLVLAWLRQMLVVS